VLRGLWHGLALEAHPLAEYLMVDPIR